VLGLDVLETTKISNQLQPGYEHLRRHFFTRYQGWAQMPILSQIPGLVNIEKAIEMGQSK
jgi:hypothetical protein